MLPARINSCFKCTLLFIMTSLALTSCSPKMYIPDMVQMPLAEKQGELKISAYATPEHNFGLGINASYAATKHLLLTAGYMQQGLKNFDTSQFSNFYSFSEIGAGYYTSANKLKWGLLGSAGFGYTHERFHNDAPFSSGPQSKEIFTGEAKFLRLAGVLYIGALQKKCTYGFALRVSNAGYFAYDYTYGSKGIYFIQDQEKNNVSFVEPVAYISTNDPVVNFFFQCGLSISSKSRNTDYTTYYPLIIAGGMYIKVFTRDNQKNGKS